MNKLLKGKEGSFFLQPHAAFDMGGEGELVE